MEGRYVRGHRHRRRLRRACACATAMFWSSRNGGEASAQIRDGETMLDFAIGPKPTALSCQLRVTSEMDGLTVRVPASQH